ncbi:MAG: hypothetical protein U9N19_09830 [Thermodesulfobacteriota bacterium]|nr:hypothetical protein [Thermodesulfobacteriota bacterium]
MNLARIDVNELDVFTNPCDLRKDLHVFVDYVSNRVVKRSTRGNNLTKVDARRLAKLITDPDAVEQVEENAWGTWLDHIDWLVLKLGFVDYDTKGTYLGYSSSEPSYSNNYIKYQGKKYNRFMARSLQDQEQFILNTLIEHYSYSENELLQTGVRGCLNTFDTWGCATGVLPLLNFAKSRRLLLNILKRCESNVWYSFASLVQYLKSEHPWFLIPEKPLYKHPSNKLDGRYDNFREGKRYSGDEKKISINDPNAFEKVEGRYVERFLEGIPLTMGYLSVAYDRHEDEKIYPSMNKLKGFKLSQDFLRFMHKDIIPPKVTVQPNFEIHVESVFYPAGIMAKLAPLADIVSSDTVSILKLKKKKVAAQLARNESLNVTDLLKDISGKNLPQNVLAELEEWAGHSQVFTLYDGFALLEGDKNLLFAKDFIVENIAPSLRIVRSPEELFSKLEEQELIPLLVKHRDKSLKPLPDKVKTIFAKTTKARPKRKKKERFVLKRKTSITLCFPTKSLFEKCRKALIGQRVPVEVDPSANTITYLSQHKALVASTLKTLEKDYVIRIEDIDS